MKFTKLAAITLASALAGLTLAASAQVTVGGAAMYASRTIVDNAVNSKDHTTLVAAVKAAGLVDTLKGPGPFTVFAPTNTAFAALPAGTVDTLLKPENIICMAVNYMEDGTLPEPAPMNAFMKSPSAIIGDGDTMILPDMAATIFEGEAELAVVIGKRASHVKAADAMSYVFGYTNFIDGSARGVVPPTNVFYQMKSRDTFAPIGPFIVTADEIKDPHKLQIRLTNNGVVMQNFNTDDMAHKIPRCIEWITSIHTLHPGDILATGTNHRGLNPFMDGDNIELTCEGCGTLHIAVRDDLKRTWTRITRLQHKQSGAEGAHTKQTGGKYAPSK